MLLQDGSPIVETAFSHNALYQFWLRSCRASQGESQGVWCSNLATVTVRFLTASELQEVGQLHHLKNIEFGICVQWQYNNKPQAGQIRWCVDSKHPHLIFPDRSAAKTFANRADASDKPPVLYYTLFNANEISITIGDLEERVYLQHDTYRLREIRQNGQLIRRVWENKQQ